MKITRIASSKFHSPNVVDTHIVEIGIDMVAQFKIEIGIHYIPYPVSHIVKIHIAIGNRNTVHSHNFGIGPILVSKRVRQTKNGIDVTLCMESL